MDIAILLFLKLFFGSNGTFTLSTSHHPRKIKDVALWSGSSFSAKQELYSVILFFGYHLFMDALNPVAASNWIFKKAVVKWTTK
ncbi:MAG: hypothetical protein Q8R55_07820 [Candidatus Taylorbacteria bacterium]|nr:hypothetical protein [Candidatus Taylorbacteria bacterium]